MEYSVEEIGAKMDALGLWPALAPFNWAVKIAGVAFPYFCSVLKGEQKPIKVRFLMLEGWQTLHDFVRTRADRNFGVYSAPVEFPHFELVILDSGAMKLFRHDTGYVPIEANAAQRAFAARLLWEAYGVMLRIEGDPKLPMKFANEKAIFARVEDAHGVWRDTPLVIPDPPPYTEKISFSKEDLKRAKDLPFIREAVLHVDFRLIPNVITKESPRPRAVYQLLAYDPIAKKAPIDLRASLTREGGLKGLWEAMPSQFLKTLIARGGIPGEVKVRSGRVFRMFRPLCLELPIKLSLHDSLEGL